MITLIEDPKKELEYDITCMTDGSELNVTIIPAYCASCRRQIEGFFYFQNARIGQVGTIPCNHCGMEIHCTVHDGSQDSIYMIPEIYSEQWSYVGENQLRSHVEIDFQDLYQINTKTMKKLEKILLSEQGEQHFLVELDQSKLELNDLIDQVMSSLKLNELPNEKIMTDDRFNMLPEKVNKWLNLLKVLHII
ncbi:hypothetical protein [Ornithinibacillus xuwenensis]|uniref:Uncharacterized protein n=1 Tax=Ornithinibacillus xuwenensis TaxID=3144668 RepID=A0ABU9XFI6_9BACI